LPEKSRQLATSAWITETFWCMTTEFSGAFRMRPRTFPASIGEVHQPSPQARTPRCAHWSANARSLSYTVSGIAPRLWFTR